MVKEGNIVKAPDDSLVTINQVHPIYVTFSVAGTGTCQRIRERMKAAALPVEVDAPGNTALKLKGELSFIDNTVDMTTGRIRLKATFENADGAVVARPVPANATDDSHALSRNDGADTSVAVQPVR